MKYMKELEFDRENNLIIDQSCKRAYRFMWNNTTDMWYLIFKGHVICQAFKQHEGIISGETYFSPDLKYRSKWIRYRNTEGKFLGRSQPRIDNGDLRGAVGEVTMSGRHMYNW